LPYAPDRPRIRCDNACNLCHLDRSLAWTRDALLDGWGKHLVLPRELEDTFGPAHATPAGEAWLAQPNGMLKVVVAAAYARSPLGKPALPRLFKTLEDPNAYVRMRSLQAIEHLLGRSLSDQEYRLTASPGNRQEQVRALMKLASER
jgi:hypothetical protein